MKDFPPIPPEDEARLAAYFTQKAEAMVMGTIDRLFVETLSKPAPVPPPLPPVNLSDSFERLIACATGLGYVAGLAGSRKAPDPSSTPLFLKAWRNGWRQGRNHRAKALADADPGDVFTAKTIRAAMARIESVPT